MASVVRRLTTTQIAIEPLDSGMKDFKQFCETAELVDQLGDALTEGIRDMLPSGDEEFGDRAWGAVGELGRGALKGAAGLVTKPLGGMARAARRLWRGSKGVEQADAQSMLKSSKQELLRALMYMDAPVRAQEIEKLKILLTSIKDKDPDSWSMLSGFDKWALGARGGINYKKLAGN